MENLKAVLLDIDGTLLLSNDAHAQAFVDAAKTLGIPADFDRIRRLIGKGGDKLLPEVFGIELESDTGEKLSVLKGKIFRTLLPSLQPTPGTRALLSRFCDDGLKLVIATSAGKEDVWPLLEQAGVRDLIEKTTSSDDAESSKPDPDILVAALQKVGVHASSAVMIGDTPYDVEAAGRAGVRIISVRSGGWSDADLRGSIAVYDDPADILRHYDETPFAIRRR
jgi:HAD superfamily hydrolase (TIGR01509 family)